MPDSGLSKNERLAAAKGGINILIQKAIEYPVHAISKALNAFYRLILMLLLIFSFLNLYKLKKENPLFALNLLTASYMASRTLFFSLNSNFETRYMVTTIPFIETLVVLYLLSLLNKNK